jgi:hypothetical protein
MEKADYKHLRKGGGKDIEKGDEAIAGQSSEHEDLPPMAVGEPPKKRLNEKLTYGETGNNEA